MRATAARHAVSLWDGLPDIDERRVARFSTAAAKATAPMRSVAADLSAGMVAVLLDDTPDIPLRAIAATADPEVWRQPFLATWHALSEGHSYAAALLAGQGRAGTTARDEVTRTQRDTFTASDADDRIVGWRRVPSGKVCNWCATVATQRYHTADSAAFGHNNCSCTPIPIIGDRDPGRVLNRGLQNVGDSPYVDEHGHSVPRPEETTA